MACNARKLILLRLTLISWGAVLTLVCIGTAMPVTALDENNSAFVSAGDVVAAEYGADMYSACDGGSVKLTEEELELLARVISAEARGESYEGQVAVGAVVLNRVAHEGFPDSIREVCTQPGAFSGVADGQINIEPSQSCRAAACAAAMGEDPTGGAIFFYNPKTAASEWIRSRPVVVVIGDHCFCV